jgi:hypothetical protein
MKQIKRVGNWYKVSINGVGYNVLIQKEPNSIVCDPSSIIVVDDEMNIMDSNIHDQVQLVMERVDWKFDMVDEN